MRLPRCGRIRLVSSGARRLERFQEQTGVGELVLIRRVRQQFHGFVVGRFFFRRIAG